MMARWICPYCEKVATISPLLVGHPSTCPDCGQMSMVIDADAEQIAKLRLEKGLESANSQSLRSVVIARLLLKVVVCGSWIVCLLMLVLGQIALFLLGLIYVGSLLLSAGVAFIILDAIDEVHRCRKLLEELLRKRG